MRLSGYGACRLYRAMKFHFTSDYDIVKYKGKVKYTKQQFESCKHKHLYEKLASKYDKIELFHFLLANFIESDDIWIRSLVVDTISLQNYKEYNRRIESLTYLVKNDILNTFEGSSNVFKVIDGEYPTLLRKMLRKEVCMETIIIMDEFMDFLSKWEKNIKDDIIFPKILFKMRKYGKLLQYDKDKFKNLLREGIQNHIL